MNNMDNAENCNIYALLVGVGKYDKIDGPNLSTYCADTALIKEALIRGLKTTEDNIRVLTGENNNGYVSSAAVAYAIAGFEKGLKENDIFIMYFSGHGKGKNIVLSNGEIILQSLIDYIEKIPAASKLVILDCCYSGDFKGFGARQMEFDDLMSEFAGKGIAVMASSAPNEQSRLNTDIGASVFTVALSESITSRLRVKKGFLSLNQIYEGMMDNIDIWNQRNPEKQQHPVFRSSIGGTLFFRVRDYKEYKPREISYERPDYMLIKVEPLSTVGIKRLAAFIVTGRKADNDELCGITNEVVDSIKNARVYRSEYGEAIFGDSPARAIWCYFGCDESDILNGLHYGYTIWAADEETKGLYYRGNNRDSLLINGICVIRNASYEMLKEMQTPTDTREHFISTNKRLLSTIVSMAEQFIYDLQEVNNNVLKLSDIYERYGSWTKDVIRKYIELSDTDIAPDDLKEWSDGVLDLAGWVVDIAVILNKACDRNYIEESEKWLIKHSIEKYHNSLEKFSNIKALID